jgi:predicted nucleic acid-binding Zn ribbon protein
MTKKKSNLTAYEKRRLRTQQIVFIVIGGIVILSMVISLLINI